MRRTRGSRSGSRDDVEQALEEEPVKSIVLLKVARGQVDEVDGMLRHLRTVLECCMPFGRYDEAALIQGESLEELWQILCLQIKPVSGVLEVFPCLIPEDKSLTDPPEHLREFVVLSE